MPESNQTNVKQLDSKKGWAHSKKGHVLALTGRVIATCTNRSHFTALSQRGVDD